MKKIKLCANILFAIMYCVNYKYISKGDKMEEISKSKKLVLGALCVALNIALGVTVGSLNLPFYGDTIGTIFSAIFFGPLFGAVVGFLSSFIKSTMFSGIQNLPFAAINVMIGLVVGYIFKKTQITMVKSILVGILLSFLCAFVGTPIGIAVYGGLTGTMSDIVVLALKQSGAGLFTASFVAKIGNNAIDKIGSCIIVFGIIKALPSVYKPSSFFTNKKAA